MRQQGTRSSSHPAYTARVRPSGLLLLGDDQIFDLVIGGLWYYLFRDQLIFLVVWPVINDLLRVLSADAGKSIEFFLAGRIDVQQAGGGGFRVARLGGSR